jgi:hypothetical protein
MFRTQRELALDFHQMNQIEAAYLESVCREIRMRRMLGMLEPRPVSQEVLSSRDREAGSWPREVLYKKGKSSPWVIIQILQAGVSPGDSA